MIAALSENPAVLNPKKVLTPVQAAMLVDIDYYRKNFLARGCIVIGPRRCNLVSLEKLKSYGLISIDLNNFKRAVNLTQAGQLALDRLKKDD